MCAQGEFMAPLPVLLCMQQMRLNKIVITGKSMKPYKMKGNLCFVVCNLQLCNSLILLIVDATSAHPMFHKMSITASKPVYTLQPVVNTMSV